jgi:hypothetical protein
LILKIILSFDIEFVHFFLPPLSKFFVSYLEAPGRTRECREPFSFQILLKTDAKWEGKNLVISNHQSSVMERSMGDP